MPQLTPGTRNHTTDTLTRAVIHATWLLIGLKLAALAIALFFASRHGYPPSYVLGDTHADAGFDGLLLTVVELLIDAVWLTGGVLFLFWVFDAARKLGDEAPHWVWGSWLVPVVNLFVPYLILNSWLNAASSREQAEKPSGGRTPLWIWWAADNLSLIAVILTTLSIFTLATGIMANSTPEGMMPAEMVRDQYVALAWDETLATGIVTALDVVALLASIHVIKAISSKRIVPAVVI